MKPLNIRTCIPKSAVYVSGLFLLLAAGRCLGAAWEGADNFCSGISPAKWKVVQKSEGQMTVKGTNCHASFLDSTSTTTAEQNAYILWNGTPTAADDWMVDIGGHNSASYGDGGSQLQLAVADTASLATSVLGYRIALVQSPSGQHFDVAQWSNGLTLTRATMSTTTTDCHLRLVYHSASQQLEAWYEDPTVPSSGWTRLDTISLAQFAPSMGESGKFTFGILSDTYYGPLLEGDIWADDFNAGLPAGASCSVTTSSSPAAGGTTTGEGTYTNGESVTVTANPNGCYDFTSWTKQSKVQSTDPSYTFTVTDSEALVANFTLKKDVITTASNPAKGGTTTGKGTYGCDKTVTVKAVAAAGYKFISWTVGAPTVSTHNPYSFPATTSEELTANFADVSVPTVTITSPAAKEKVDTTLLTVSGTAKNVLGVSDVILTFNGNRVSTTTTNNWTNWSASVLLTPGTNVISATALSEPGNPSKTETVTFENTAAGEAPVALAGLLGVVQVGSNAPFAISFGTATFEQVSADTNQGSSVGNYTYTQTGPGTAIFATSAFAPPSQSGPGGAPLTFSSTTSATFTNGDGTTGTITLSPVSGLDVSSLSGWTITSVDLASNTTIATFGDGTCAITQGSGPKTTGSFTSTQYGPMAIMVVETNADTNLGGVETNYSLMMFSSRSNGQFFLTTYDGAGDPPTYDSGAFTAAYQPDGLHYVAPESLNGIEFKAMGSPETLTFGQATFGRTSFSSSTNEVSLVANYTYTRTGANSATVISSPYLPQPNIGRSTNFLTFQGANAVTIDNITAANTSKLTWSVLPKADYLAPAALSHATIQAVQNGKSQKVSFNFGDSLGKNPGTYTYAQFSPNVGMLINIPTSGTDAGIMEYVQFTFNSPSGGSSPGDFYNAIPNDSYIAIGTFTFK